MAEQFFGKFVNQTYSYLRQTKAQFFSEHTVLTTLHFFPFVVLVQAQAPP